ncbi:putative hydro-lyase [Algirhabdus cladophorae]|uniref:putative hydro-lyase n=1 Tax=Algirhabdus cladophorae TaxID=3377108 RepID=UPI003B84B525
MADAYEEIRTWDQFRLRQSIRNGDYTAHTAGLARGTLQTNVAIMSAEHALDFMRFCQRNPKPCPLVGVSDTGNPMMFTLGADIDIRRDIPAYNIYRNGILDAEQPDITDLWQDDFVAFALGCSFTFERALQAAAIPLWHIDNNTTVPMFRTNIETIAAGPFHGKTVVSLRMIDPSDVDRVVKISKNYPLAHGAPLHIGDPGQIGITDLSQPEWGDPVSIKGDKVPVFWACGVTPQVAIEAAKLPIFITHKPGHMLITDVHEQAEVPNHTTNPNQHGETS